jgi:hypothetical protein
MLIILSLEVAAEAADLMKQVVVVPVVIELLCQRDLVDLLHLLRLNSICLLHLIQ